MKKVQIILAALVLFTVVAFTVTDNTKLVKINHKGKVIEVAEQAVKAHLAHGDYLDCPTSASKCPEIN